MIRFQTESKIYRFVKDTLSFTDTKPIWLSTIRNATIPKFRPDDRLAEFEFEYFPNSQ